MAFAVLGTARLVVAAPQGTTASFDRFLQRYSVPFDQLSEKAKNPCMCREVEAGSHRAGILMHQFDGTYFRLLCAIPAYDQGNVFGYSICQNGFEVLAK